MPMPSKTPETPAEQAEQGLMQYAYAYGNNPLPPTLTATLITAQHLRPLQLLPLAFSPVLLFSSYLNINGYKKDSAGVTSAWSAAYVLLARRRKQGLGSKFGARGLVRGATVALCAGNVVGGGLAYVFGRRKEDVKE
ncbi:hypothetical protein D0869_07066 [Hortaea werneckii]|uniref:Uncharacterized protein n=1 Tax=Hortaea werneckii TaxID=91943 RepID=A0A3M6WRB3_HORWE|nr:hypothetical protein KC324_g12838 [Hortaea werneckii]KAI7558360.1 hypothetical protein KC316_g13299 [Hortaea werneckii]RMX81105.1 hypothetical protein D0869_07066 [Hortaea werneckii]RMX95101.1 hypothetical protein D0868_11923 [Hortaea werneckii]